ncbi:MAG: hypothetical protein ACLFRX_00015 [Gemmatimonadota bacterium]
MTGARTSRILMLVAGLLAVGPAAGPTAAQSITSIRGLGYPLVPVDARTEVLGGLGVGLQGLAAPLTNPAAAAGVLRRGAVVSLAALEQEAALGDATDAMGTTRFPLIRILFPVGDVVLTAGYGGYLDQSWAVSREGEQLTGGDLISYRDLIRSTGGIGQFQVGAAAPVGSRLAVGAAVGLHTGSRRLDQQRLFDSTAFGRLEPFTDSRTVHYSAPMAQLGAQWDPLEILRVGASVTWAGTLTADSARGSAVTTEYELPLQVAGGASAYLAPTLLATVSGRWSGWSTTGDIIGLGGDGAGRSAGRDTWEVGGGLELDNPDSRAERSYPLRLGFQYRELPFTFVSEAPTEWFVGAGAGMRLGPSAENPLARVDLTVQRGERSTPGGELGELTESAWRFSLSLSIFGM